MRRRTMSVLLIVTAVATVVVGGAAGAKQDARLNLVAYSTPKPVMSKIISAYQSTPAGSGVSFTQSYGGSTAQAQAVVNGQPADLVFLSTGTDVNLLVDHGLVDRNYDKQSYKGVAANSVVVFAVRDGNPKKIKGWNDLLKPGVEVVTPNPFTAGIAKWNILAAYGAQRHLGKTDKQAIAFVKNLFDHVVSQDSSGSNATNTFLSGKGDVLLTFESEAINGRIPFVIPRQTMLIDIYIAAIEKSQNKPQWNAFSRYLKTYPAQKILAENGYRPVNKQALNEFRSKFPVRAGETKITSPLLGGWRAVDKKWFDPKSSIMQRIEGGLGVPTGS